MQLSTPTPQLLRDALAAATGNAQYWQALDGYDLLAQAPEMQVELGRVADHVAASSLTSWWYTPTARPTQYAVQWEGESTKAVSSDVHEVLRASREHERRAEDDARRRRAADPAANWSGEWWSRPPEAIPSFTRALSDGSPAGLWFVEDGKGWERAEVSRTTLPEDRSVFEIAGATDWAELCARFPKDVTSQKQDDWYRVTAHASAWVVPDWVQVADHYDAVHLQVGAYLAAAGTAIPVTDGSGFESVIAGWNPDATYWFSSDAVSQGAPTGWVLADDGSSMVWKSDSNTIEEAS